MIELKKNELVFSFPEVHEEANMRVHSQRTLRIPDDNGTYPLPAGLGNSRFAMWMITRITCRMTGCGTVA